LRVVTTTSLSLFYRAKKTNPTRAKNVNFVIVSIANRKVKDSLDDVIRETRKFGVKRYVVIDEGSELTDYLKKEDIELVVVPKSYKCKAIAKGRAINYFIEKCVKRGEWYMFLDDDAYPLDDSFLQEIPYYEKKGFVGGNGILVPRRGKSSSAFVLDHFRYLDDLTLFRATQGTIGKPFGGFHGEGLILKGEVLKDVGYNFRSMTEDFRFAQELTKRGYRTWQSKTKVSILSPNSMRDLVMQRARWFKGALLDTKNASWEYRLVSPILHGAWIISILGTWPFIVPVLMTGSLSPFLFPLFAMGTTYCIAGFFVLPKASIKEKLVALLISPVECLAPFVAIRLRGYYVVDKSK